MLNQARNISSSAVKDCCDWSKIVFDFMDRRAGRCRIRDVNAVVTKVNAGGPHPFEIRDDLVVRCRLGKTEDSEACAGIAGKLNGAFGCDSARASCDHQHIARVEWQLTVVQLEIEWTQNWLEAFAAGCVAGFRVAACGERLCHDPCGRL